MNKQYIVTEPFGGLDKGSIFNWNGKEYECISSYEDEEYTSHYDITMSQALVDDYVKAGLLQLVEEVIPVDAKWEKVIKEIEALENKYKRRNEAVAKKYKAGKMQTCKKVEHDTVYYNLTKLLNHFKAIINE